MVEVKGQGHTLVQLCCGKGVHVDAGPSKSWRRAVEVSTLGRRRPSCSLWVRKWELSNCYLQARWEEITTWSDQRGRKIETALSELRANAAMLDQLMGWLMAAEANLSAQANEMLPDNLPVIEQLLQDHQVCAVHTVDTVWRLQLCADKWMFEVGT